METEGGAQPGGPSGAGSPDAGSPDAASPDAGSPDAGSPDAGSPDAGSADSSGRGRYAVAGVVTGAAGLAVSVAATALLRQRLTPPEAVAETVIELTPGRIAETLIHLVGRFDKPLLLGGVFAALVGLSAVSGVVSRRGVWRGQTVFLALGAIGVLAVLSRPGATTTEILPAVLGTAGWLLVLPVLVGAREPAGGDRRVFLLKVGVVAIGAAVVGVGGRLLGHERRAVEAARSRLRLPVTRGTPPPGAEVGVPGLEPWRVSASDFYRIDTAVAVPVVSPDDWRLRIHGMVEREVTVSYADLLDRQLTEAWVTLCCVSNPIGGDLIGNAWWSGVKVSELLAEAGPLPGADAVRQTSHDGWNCGTPLTVLTDERDALLAIAMNGRPLPLEHGYPVRMVVPGLYGYVSATKWVVDLEVTRFADFEAFWTQRGWSAQGPVKTQSRIDVPGANRAVAAGDVTVAGVAWAQHIGIEKVEVQLDGGAWQGTELGRVPSDDTWVQWRATVRAEPGTHRVAVRATDRSGTTQTAVRRGVIPDGATGWHTVEFTAE